MDTVVQTEPAEPATGKESTIKRSGEYEVAGQKTMTPTWVDWAVVTVLIGISWLTLFIVHDLVGTEAETSAPRWLEYLLMGATIFPLAWRRVAPLRILVVVTGFSLIVFGLRIPDTVGPVLALFLALFAAGAHSRDAWRDRARATSIGLTTVLIIVQIVGQQDYVGFDAALFSGYIVVINVGYFGVAWLLGDASRRRQEDTRELKRLADQLAAGQWEKQQKAILDERVRIARELHDVVAHHVSVMGVQAGAARRVLQSDPERATEVLSGVEQSGREAVRELQRAIGFLRRAQDQGGMVADHPFAPQPTLADLDAMVTASPVPSRIQRIGTPRLLPSAVELSAFRIVQEALTNVLKHAGPVSTTVVLTYAPAALHVEVVNERGTVAAVPPGSGRGLLGMRERAAMLGGELTYGTIRTGGFRISAVLATAGPPEAAHGHVVQEALGA